MPAPSPSSSAAPFGAHDYQIRCTPTEAPREVNIRARAALPLRVGDLYTIGHRDRLCDLIVEEISLLAGGDWNARCQVSNSHPL